MAVVAFGILEVGSDDPIVDPTLAIMEALTLLTAPLIVVLMGSVCVYAPQERKLFGVIALSLGVIMAGLTSAVHFYALTAGRQSGFTVLEWPSALYAIELLAWDVFLGLCLLSAAFVFPGSGIRTKVRWCLLITGSLCLFGTIGPILGDMVIQRIGILGYGIGLPISSLVLAWFFRREKGREFAKGSE
ncbi:MAG: hypothetical protein HKN85_04140 [Gammaproteobacteria bacterium]|nr:hypothetical protein [Gammaproteobacteria bacterium]